MIIFRKLLKAEVFQLISKVSSDVKSIKQINIQLFESDATDEKKFSRHVVVKVEGFCFKDITHAGFFVDQFCRKFSV